MPGIGAKGLTKTRPLSSLGSRLDVTLRSHAAVGQSILFEKQPSECGSSPIPSFQKNFRAKPNSAAVTFSVGQATRPVSTRAFMQGLGYQSIWERRFS
jgi:hypothetical protein